MEARSEPQHRTKVNLQAGLLVWVSGPASVTPNIRSWPGGSGGGSDGTLLNLTPRDLHRSDLIGRARGGNDNCPNQMTETTVRANRAVADRVHNREHRGIRIPRPQWGRSFEVPERPFMVSRYHETRTSVLFSWYRDTTNPRRLNGTGVLRLRKEAE